MAVSDRIREIESEIDAGIRALPIWQAPKADVLEQLMDAYQYYIECIFVELLDAEIFGASPDHFGAALGRENHIRSGVLWTLKWAVEYCCKNGPSNPRPPEELRWLISLGRTYEAFVDALKYANHGLVTIKVDEGSRIITCYEGGNATRFDTHIIKQGRIFNPTTAHVSLTEDGDQLTSRWTAGDYRRVTKMLANYAASKENTITVDLKQIGKPAISKPSPTIVWLARPSMVPDCHVFDDLVLPTVIDTQLKWKLVSLLDTPIIMVGDRYCALSSDLKALSKIDDYMLRLAARVDEQQYNLANGLREERMVRICEGVLKRCSRPWTVRDRVHYTNPSQEADILATRDDKRLVLQLKSTLRPETPWEVYKRNEGKGSIIEGIKHTKSLIDRGAAEYGFVVTDGDPGDYTCWAEALTCGIPITTLYDLEIIANDPVAAISDMKSRVGITADSPTGFPERLPDREGDLLDWKLRLHREKRTENTTRLVA